VIDKSCEGLIDQSMEEVKGRKIDKKVVKVYILTSPTLNFLIKNFPKHLRRSKASQRQNSNSEKPLKEKRQEI
jgi:hypothetical protein